MPGEMATLTVVHHSLDGAGAPVEEPPPHDLVKTLSHWYPGARITILEVQQCYGCCI